MVVSGFVNIKNTIWEPGMVDGVDFGHIWRVLALGGTRDYISESYPCYTFNLRQRKDLKLTSLDLSAMCAQICARIKERS